MTATHGANLSFGQIRVHNFEALRHHYGCDPPWDMANAPHRSLASAASSTNYALEWHAAKCRAYRDYLDSHAADTEEQRDLAAAAAYQRMQILLYEPEQHARVMLGAVLDGNHRVAASLESGSPLTQIDMLPYQTVLWPDGRRDQGRRDDVDLPVDFGGRHVVDLGTNHGMRSIQALQKGAVSVVAVDNDLTSVTWAIRDAWGFTERMAIRVEDIDQAERYSGDLVLALSVAAHISSDGLLRQIVGRDCIYETHRAGDPLPLTGHQWKRIATVPHSVASPDLERDIWRGEWRG